MRFCAMATFHVKTKFTMTSRNFKVDFTSVNDWLQNDHSWTQIHFSASLSINIASVSANWVDLSPSPSVGLCVCRSVCLPIFYTRILMFRSSQSPHNFWTMVAPLVWLNVMCSVCSTFCISRQSWSCLSFSPHDAVLAWYLSVCVSVTNRFSTKTARWIMQTTPHDSPGTLSFPIIIIIIIFVYWRLSNRNQTIEVL